MNGHTGAAGTRFERPLLRPRYNESEVDELIDRIEATLAGTAEPGRAVTAQQVRGAQFSTVRHPFRRGGYDQESVDNALDAYVERLSRR